MLHRRGATHSHLDYIGSMVKLPKMILRIVANVDQGANYKGRNGYIQCMGRVSLRSDRCTGVELQGDHHRQRGSVKPSNAQDYA
jgi:hypothetical protein